MSQKLPPPILVGEYEFLICTKEKEYSESSRDYFLTPGFQELMHSVGNDLNQAKLEGRHILKIRIQVHAQNVNGVDSETCRL